MPAFYEFFAGAGMARAGLGANWDCLFANDIDARKAAAYAANFGRQGLVVADVGALTPVDLPGKPSLVWASPPCQDLSLAGDRAGLNGERSGAFWPFWRLMEGLCAEGRAPQLVVIENVTGLLTSHGGKDFDAICNALADAGYRFGALVIDAKLFVPQSRERVFIVAVDAGAPIPAELISDGPAAREEDLFREAGQFHPPTLIAACRRQRDPLWWRLPMPPKRNVALTDLLEPDTDVSWHAEAKTAHVLGLMDATNAAKLAEAQRQTNGRVVGAVYRRTRPDGNGGKTQRAEVRFDGVAGALRTAAGGSSKQTILVADGDRVRSRLLSPREGARLMGLPDSYQLPAKATDAYDLVGDGVVVPVVRFLAEHILEPVLRAEAPAQPIAAQ